MRRRSLIALAALVGALLVTAFVAVATRDRARSGGRPTPPAARSYAELVAANYRVLTPAQTQRLLRFADALYGCMSDRHASIGKPKPLGTKIELRVSPDANRESLAHAVVACGERLGGPPHGASLVLVKAAVELYLPKYCLLDRKVVALPEAQ